MENFKESGIYSKQAHVNIPEGLFEEEHGRKGFFGRVSHLYHDRAPVEWSDIKGPLMPRNLPPSFEKVKKNSFVPVLYNSDVVISLGKVDRNFEFFQRNADYDEIFFIHKGEGTIETIYGPLDYQKGDYLIIPRGTTYKFYPKNNECLMLRVESNSEFEQPDRGMLGPNALYDQTVLKTPQAAQGSENDKKEYKLQIKREGEVSEITYPFNPLTAKGWKGSVYPYILSIYDICPIMSHRYHIPPSGHTTFVAKNFVICSFVERPLEDSKHGVLKVPFYHSNIDFDEVLFYHQGDFFSRDNIDEGALTFHPQGIHHGPHPGAFAKADDKTYTNEYAVMVDTQRPLKRTNFFQEHENKEYWKSWMPKKGDS